jgi:hypothetical protein
MLKNGQQAFTVVDEKVFSDGSRTTTATPKATIELAESAYYDILSKAAADGSPYHAAYLLEANRGCIMSKFYDRTKKEEASAE